MTGCVDVRDVAEAHFKAIKIEEAKNQRFAVINIPLWFKQMAEPLKTEFQSKGYRVVTDEMQLKDVGDQITRLRWEKGMSWDNSRSREVLGIEYRDMNKAIVEMAYSLIELGVIP